MAKPPKAPAAPPVEGELIGYARVSTEDQNLDMQMSALRKAGVADHRVYSESVSGVSKRRPQLRLAIKAARPGDTFVVWKLDRMGRSMADLLKLVQELTDAGVGLRSLTEGLDTATPIGKLMLHFLGALAQFERDLIVERTREGVRRHIERGGRIGAERKMTPAKLRECEKLLRSGLPVREVAARLGVAPMTVYTYFRGEALVALRRRGRR